MKPMMDEDWQIENDLRTLMEAERIEKDPKRLKAAKDLARKKAQDIKSLLDESEKDEQGGGKKTKA